MEAESRVVVTLSGGEYKGFIFKTSAGTLSAKSDHAQEPSACSGAMGHKSASPKTSTEVYLDLPSTPGTVTVTAEVVSAKTSVFEVTLDITVVEREARYYRILDGTPRDDTSEGCQDDYMTIPDDCVIAPNTPEVLELIAQHYWGTHGVCVDDGRCYWGLHGGGSVGNQDCSSSMNGFHTTTIGGETAYMPPCCSERILLECTTPPPPAPSPPPPLVFNAGFWILDGTSRDDTSQGCQEEYLTIPDDCVIAPNTPEVLELIAQHYWGTHGVCVDDGSCYWGLHGGGSVGNQDCSSSMDGFHTTTIGGETAYRPPCCLERILLKCEGGSEGDGGGNEGDGGGNEGNGRDGLVFDEEDSAGRSSVAIPLLFAVAAVVVAVPAV